MKYTALGGCPCFKITLPGPKLCDTETEADRGFRVWGRHYMISCETFYYIEEFEETALHGYEMMV